MNNFSNIITSTLSLEQQSLKDLDSQVLVNVFLFLIALATIFSNLGMLIGLYKGGNSFKSHHYKLVIHSSAVAGFQALFIFIIMGVVRFVDTIFRIPANLTVKDCGLLLLILEITIAVDPYNVLVLSIDRLTAVVLPFHYKNMNLSKLYKICTLTVPWFLGCVDVSAKFLLYTSDFIVKNLSICLMANTRTVEFANYRYYRGIVVGGFTICFYLLGIVFVKYKIHMDVSHASQLKKELGFRLMLTCAIDALVYTCTYYLSQIYSIVLVANMLPQARTTVAPIIPMFILLATTPRFFVNYFFNREFKKSVNMNMICCRMKNSINAATTGGGTNGTTITTLI